MATRDPSINAARITDRVKRGGHEVPIRKIIDRYERSIANLAPLIALADRVYVYDNSIDDVEARLCARTRDGLLAKIYGPLPEWVADTVEPLPRTPDFVDLRAP